MEKLKLVIVESPAKSRTISRFLGKDYRIVATMGHMRDLPADKFAVDIEKGFEPTYTIMEGKSKTVSALRKAAEGCDSIFLATDEDREGEAIAWHTAHILKKDPAEMKRVAFHEITSEAVKNAFKKPRGIDIRLVNSQQARRILDRVVGYTLSPLLGQRIKKGLSAGRVQSAALRILVDREKEIKAFVPEQYFVISAELVRKENPDFPFNATLSGKDNKKFPKPGIKERDEAEKITAFLQANPLLVASIRREEKKEYPQPPFTTSTLQQEAGRRLNLPATRTMSIAQELYEGVDLGPQGAEGLITYHRTDSLTIA
ncbi:MAG: DNA topoisomerase, partial [Candidatus Ratteibacteria bacterium]